MTVSAAPQVGQPTSRPYPPLPKGAELTRRPLVPAANNITMDQMPPSPALMVACSRMHGQAWSILRNIPLAKHLGRQALLREALADHHIHRKFVLILPSWPLTMARPSWQILSVNLRGKTSIYAL